jgi:simple sugar transport system ATP-binding protein
MAQSWVEPLGHPDASADAADANAVRQATSSASFWRKWLATKPKVLILDSPTVGVDIGNKQGIYDVVRELAARGGSPSC